MTTAIVAAIAFFGGYMAHKVQWHIKAYKKGKDAYQEWEDSRDA